MAIEIRVPGFGESISEVEIGEWLKTEGDYVEQDETMAGPGKRIIKAPIKRTLVPSTPITTLRTLLCSPNT